MCRIQESSPHASEKCTWARFFSVSLSAVLYHPTPHPAKLPLLLPDSLHAPSIGGPVLHFAACFLAFITIQEVFANETLFSSFGSFRSSAARAARSLSNLLLLLATSRTTSGVTSPGTPISSKATRLPLGPNRLRNLGNSGKFGSEPCSNTIFLLIFLARASDCRRE